MEKDIKEHSWLRVVSRAKRHDRIFYKSGNGFDLVEFFANHNG